MRSARMVLACAMWCLMPILASGAEQSIGADDQGQVDFVTPSGNIGCTYTPEGGTDVYMPAGGGPELQCSRIEPSYVTVILGPGGPPERIDNPGEQGCCSVEPKLEYGNSWSAGPFTCASTTSGLSCRSAAGHGFSMSRASITTH